jgi:predicted nucleotidyltransferase
MITFVNQDDSAISLPIHIDARRIADFCRRHDIVRLCLFGSVLRDDFGPDSDIDVLVAFAPGKTPGWEFFGMQDELSLIMGRQVELNTPNFLSRYFRDEVVAGALPIYESGRD